MGERPDFQEKQYAFAAHIRDPDNAPAPADIEDRRMGIYRELFFNNLKSLLSSTYPVLKELHDERHWRRLIRQFMQVHRASTPYFLELPAEFLHFLTHEYESTDTDFPFLAELAHYEYIELALSVSDIENDLDGIDPDGNLLSGVPVKSGLAWLYAYQYPVHRIAKDYLPTTPSETPVCLAVARDADGKVRFHELNPAMAALLETIADNPESKTGETLLRELAKRLSFPDHDQFVAHGERALSEFRQSDIILGTRPGEGESNA